MARKLLAGACLFVVLGQLAGASSQRLEDSAALVQTVARVKDEVDWSAEGRATEVAEESAVEEVEESAEDEDEESAEEEEDESAEEEDEESDEEEDEEFAWELDEESAEEEGEESAERNAGESATWDAEESAEGDAQERPHIRPLRELLTEAGQKWAEKSEVAGKKWIERQEEKMAHVDQKIREKLQSLSEPPTEEQKQEAASQEQEDFSAMSEEAKIEKYGYPITLVVTDPLERRLHIKFREHTKLHALFNSLCKRSRLHLDTVSFVSGSRLLRGNETAASAGLTDGAVIELHSDVLKHKQEQKRRAEKAAARHAQVLVEKEEAERLDHELKVAAHKRYLADLATQKADFGSQIKQAAEAAKTKAKKHSSAQSSAYMRREMRLKKMKEGHMVDLKFVDTKGNKVVMAFKRNHWFGPLQTLVCKRFGMNETDTGFFWYNDLTDVRIGANATVQSLRLPNHALIKVVPMGRHA